MNQQNKPTPYLSQQNIPIFIQISLCIRVFIGPNIQRNDTLHHEATNGSKSFLKIIMRILGYQLDKICLIDYDLITNMKEFYVLSFSH